MKQENKDPVFPVVIFPDNIRKIIDATHEESCFPVNYIAASLFFAASVAVGNYRTLEVNTFKAKAHLFMALLGSPGSGKTHPINFAIAPFLEYDKESIEEYQRKLAEWRKSPDGTRGEPIVRPPRAHGVRRPFLLPDHFLRRQLNERICDIAEVRHLRINRDGALIDQVDGIPAAVIV